MQQHTYFYCWFVWRGRKVAVVRDGGAQGVSYVRLQQLQLDCHAKGKYFLPQCLKMCMKVEYYDILWSWTLAQS